MTNWSYDAEQRVGKLVVGQGLTITQVCQLKAELLPGLDEADRVVLDTNAVKDVDIAGLQLLCSAHRFAVAHGKELLLTGAGDRAHELVRAAGFVRGSLCSIGKDASCFWAKMAR
ncbi:MAG: STAS domain-containing protein [Desulfuromonadales bacterium]